MRAQHTRILWSILVILSVIAAERSISAGSASAEPARQVAGGIESLTGRCRFNRFAQRGEILRNDRGRQMPGLRKISDYQIFAVGIGGLYL